jgi:phosphinothricin acetyltransferase
MSLEIDQITLRPATLDDLPALTGIYNYYVVNTHVTFDIDPVTVEERRLWFQEHTDGKRYRIIVAEARGVLLGCASSGRHRAKAAYDTTVETSIQCSPSAVGQGLGTRLYQTLFEELATQDIHRLVAGVAQPNNASNALHTKLGFRQIGTYSQVGRKFGKYWDVLWFERDLRTSG